jgi:cell division septation protein DedD
MWGLLINRWFALGFAALAMGYMLSCAGLRPSPKEPAKEGEKKPVLIEDLDPVELGDLNFTIPPKTVAEEDTVSIGAEESGTATPKLPSSKPRIRKVPGFRIQIAAVTSQEDAAEIQKQAMLQFEDVNVYLVFEPPYYKIRVGDFERRHDAEEFQRKAIEAGYRDAWIVRTVIQKKSP